ncbi:M24 family metallopeptidase [Stratiformator vulcanicus]|uniref:Metallopeptidase family M24 n=1 Tax=Stratiformator vulcanicus TaxID=2527980 RepID=A0A517R5X6_9PLAN|nr:M24 family metallopeptidase [Stratiformator vulcanicus]QDT39306.1 Metallopeptidase family M24 [Stratiformator vulcanicus]
MPIALNGPLEPLSSAEFSVPDFRRSDEIDERQQRVAELLERRDLDALLISQPANFAWFTVGGCNVLGLANRTNASLFLTKDARVVLANNVDSQQVFDRELNGLGFQLKERPWYEPPEVLISDLCRGRRVGTDAGLAEKNEQKSVVSDFDTFRTQLSPLEIEQLRTIGRDVVHAIEATARSCQPGQSEQDIAGEVSHRLIRRGVDPLNLQVLGDGRARLYPHGNFSNAPVVRWCSISATGRRNGLHVTATRSVAFNEFDAKQRDAHHRAVLMQATGMFFSQAGWKLSETWKRVIRIYEKFGVPDEWQLADQGEVMGYSPEETPIVPHSEFQLESGMPVCWRPSVGPSPLGDTILVTDAGHEVLTPTESWPEVTVSVRGHSMNRPDVLIRG